MIEQIVHSLIVTLPCLRAVNKFEFLDRGFSDDTKYVLWEKNQPGYLLRLSEIGLQEKRKREYSLLAEHYTRGVPCSEPYEWGVIDDGTICYSLMNQHASLMGGIFFHRDIAGWQQRITEIIETHVFLNDGPPVWFEETETRSF